jgi:hypothetical protein
MRWLYYNHNATKLMKVSQATILKLVDSNLVNHSTSDVAPTLKMIAVCLLKT